MNNGNTLSMIRHVATRRFFAVLVLFVLLFAYFGITQSKFLTSGNIDALLTGSSILWMVSIGLTFVMMTGGFDLSLGSLMAMSGIAMATFMNGWGLPLGLGILLTVLFGLLVGGLVNGVLIGRVGLPFLVVTLGTLTLYGGVVNLWSKGATEAIVSKDLTAIAFNHALGIPVPAWIMIGVFLIALYVQRSTYFGRDVYAVGGSPDAARLSGIRVTRILIAVYAIAGMLAALAGVMQVARIGAASPQVGGEIIFSAAAAVLLGGTSFSGGVGGVGGTIIGVLLLATLENGLSVSGVQSYWQQIITGVILVAVVALDRVQQVGWANTFRFARRPPGAPSAPARSTPAAAAGPES
jgi:ribose/xylose/arabinose/galactoside ABC-type transport system permease subunit